MAIKVSGELLRLLNILSVRAHGATQYELAVREGVSASVIYKAVATDLVYAERQNSEDVDSYRYQLRDAGQALVSLDKCRRRRPRRRSA